MSLVYIIATTLLSLIFFTAGIASFIQPNEPTHLGWVSAAKSSWFSFVELLSALCLLLPLNFIAHAVIAALMSAVVVCGHFMRIRSPDIECECFGSLTPRSPLLLSVISAIILGMAGFVITVAVRNPLSNVGFYWQAALCAVVIAIIIDRKLRFDNLKGAGFASRSIDLSALNALPADLVLGHIGGTPYTVADAAHSGKPIVILALSSQCVACREIYARLIAVANSFASKVALIAISHDDKLYASKSEALAPLVSKNNSLSRFLGLTVKPYAIYMRPDLTLFAPPCQGKDPVIRLLSIIRQQISESLAE